MIDYQSRKTFHGPDNNLIHKASPQGLENERTSYGNWVFYSW
jgi:hypothetical protein